MTGLPDVSRDGATLTGGGEVLPDGKREEDDLRSRRALWILCRKKEGRCKGDVREMQGRNMDDSTDE